MAKNLVAGLKLTKCWMASDGETFTDEEEAKRHQVRHNFCRRLATHFENQDIGSDDVAAATDAIMEDLDGVANIFAVYSKERNL